MGYLNTLRKYKGILNLAALTTLVPICLDSLVSKAFAESKPFTALWDKSIDHEYLSRYILFYGNPNTAPKFVSLLASECGPTTCEKQTPSLDRTKTWVFYVIAVDTRNLRSVPTNKITYLPSGIFIDANNNPISPTPVIQTPVTPIPDSYVPPTPVTPIPDSYVPPIPITSIPDSYVPPTPVTSIPDSYVPPTPVPSTILPYISQSAIITENINLIGESWDGIRYGSVKPIIVNTNGKTGLQVGCVQPLRNSIGMKTSFKFDEYAQVNFEIFNPLSEPLKVRLDYEAKHSTISDMSVFYSSPIYTLNSGTNVFSLYRNSFDRSTLFEPSIFNDITEVIFSIGCGQNYVGKKVILYKMEIGN